jgi:hypothetical protein
MFLMEYAGADGVRPYVLEWHQDVFLEAYNEKHEQPDCKIVIKGTGKNEYETTVCENVVALTTEQLIEATSQTYKRAYTKQQIRENFIYPLMNQGYIDNTDSELDKRNKIYYPVIALEGSSKDKDKKNARLQGINKSCNLFHQSKIYVENLTLYPDKQYITSRVQTLLRYTIQTPLFKEIKIVDHNGEHHT